MRTPKRSRSPLEFPDVAKRQVQDRPPHVTDQESCRAGSAAVNHRAQPGTSLAIGPEVIRAVGDKAESILMSMACDAFDD